MNSDSVVKEVKRLFRAFHYRNYRLFFTGQGISLIGTWMQQVALNWYVYSKTNSAFLLGLVTFCNHAPTFFMPPFSGLIADRCNRKTALLVTQSLSMLQAVLLTFAVYNDTGIYSVIALAAFLGCINAIDAPIRQSFVVNLVHGREDLGNAIALNSVMFNGARLFGPSIAGFIIAHFGEKFCIAFNAASFIAVIISLSMVSYSFTPTVEKRKNVLREFMIGVKYAFGEPSIRYLLFLISVISFIGFSYLSLMPIVARDVLHKDARVYGTLLGGAAIGAMFGAFYLASRKNIRGLVIVIGRMSFVVGLMMMLFSFSEHFILSMMIIPFIGMSLMLVSASTNTIIQSVVDEKMRGRVMSIYTMLFMGLTPFGSLFLGWLSGKIGVQKVFMISGIVCMTASLLFYSRRKKIRKAMHPVYVRLGLIQEND
jgi:MFS family permease